MFRKIDQNKQNEQPKDPLIKEEFNAENSIQPMGNEAANVELMNQMLRDANLETGLEFLEGNLDRINNDDDNIINNGYFIGECMNFTEKDRLCVPVPFFFFFGLMIF